MVAEPIRRSVRFSRGLSHWTVILAVVVIGTALLMAPVSGGFVGGPSWRGVASASLPVPYVSGAQVANHQESLTLTNPGELNIFGMADGGGHHTIGFSSGDLVTAWDALGHLSTAISVTAGSADNFTTKDADYAIGAVGVAGFQYFGVETQKMTPPVQPVTNLTETVVLPEAALVVVVGLSGGADHLVLSGLPGLAVDAKGFHGDWDAIEIGQSQLAAGTYTVLESTTAHDAGGANRTDTIAIFAFSNHEKGFIYRVPSPDRVVATIGVGRYPTGVAYDSERNETFVANFWSNNVSVINDSSNTVVATLAIADPWAVVYDSGKGEVFVSSYWWLQNSVVVIADTNNTVVATIGVASAPYGLAYDSARGEIFVTSSNSNGVVDVISDQTNTVVGQVPVGTDPCGLAYDSVKGEIFVANRYSDSVSVISDANDTVVATVGVGSNPIAVTFDPVLGEAFVVNMVSGNVSVISDATDKVVATIGVAYYPFDAAYDSETAEVFVPSTATNNVTVLSATSATVVATVPVGSFPQDVAADDAWGEVFVTDGMSNDVSVISVGAV